MISIFDGMDTVLADLAGEAVSYHPENGPEVDPVHGVFSEQPIEVSGPDGQDILIEAPTWWVMKDSVPHVRRGDHIIVPDGRRFQVMTVHGSGSPASDAFVICELHLDPETAS